MKNLLYPINLFVIIIAMLLPTLSIAEINLQYAQNPLGSYSKEYATLYEQLIRYQQFAALNSTHRWRKIPAGITLKEGMQDKRIIAIKARLKKTDELNKHSDIDSPTFDDLLKEDIIKYQNANGLTADGAIGRATIEALNVPLSMRIKEIRLNLYRLQQLPKNLGTRYIMVNIPDFSLKLVDNDQVVLTMPCIVGSYQRSCTVNSKIIYIEINPYWYIPHSIAVEDLLPKISENPDYLQKNNIHVFTGYGKDDLELDPAQIDWESINADNFTYKLRQEPGESNTLGRIKFVFPNKCGIYLHDTLARNLFNNHRRDLSHGCIRIAKPIELAAYLLDENSGGTLTKDKLIQLIDSNKHKVVTLKKPVNVYIVYLTSWVGEDGILQFRRDIYDIDDL